jgi:hypothetical protein
MSPLGLFSQHRDVVKVGGEPPLSFDLCHDAHVQFTSYWISFSNWILFYDLRAPLHKVYNQWVP